MAQDERQALLNKLKILLAKKQRGYSGRDPAMSETEGEKPWHHLEKGGFADKYLLSGALPTATSLGGGAVTGLTGAALASPTVVGAIPAGLATGSAGAFLAGLGGKSLEDLIRKHTGLDAPQNLTEQLKSLRNEALLELGGDLVTRGAGRVLSGTGKALAPVIKQATKKGRTVYGDLFEALVPWAGKAKKTLRTAKEADLEDVTKGELQLKKQEIGQQIEQIKDKKTYIKDLFAEQKQITDKKILETSGEFSALPSLTGTPGKDEAAKSLQKQAAESLAFAEVKLAKNVQPYLQQYGSAKVDLTSTINEIDKILIDQGGMDAAGQLLKTKDILAKDRKQLIETLGLIKKVMQDNPTVENMSKLLKDLQSDSFANFGAKDRGTINKIYGKLSHTVKENMLDGIENVAGAEVKTAISTARANYSKVKSSLSLLDNVLSQPPEKLIFSSDIVGSKMLDAVKTNPALKEPMGAVILNKIALSLRNPNALGVTRLINNFGRDALPELLDPKTLKIVLDLEKTMQVLSKRKLGLTSGAKKFARQRTKLPALTPQDLGLADIDILKVLPKGQRNLLIRAMEPTDKFRILDQQTIRGVLFSLTKGLDSMMRTQRIQRDKK